MMLEEGVEERERLRPVRARNYAVKAAANWTCQHDGCTRDFGVVVVDVKGELETRCAAHVGRLKPTPGQWIERSAI